MTGDDFGLSPVVNRAIERAHREGILGAASLMVGAPAAAEAVARAKGLPALRVGLHLVLSRGTPILSREQIPRLAGKDGRFRDDLLKAGFAYFFLPGIRRELEGEIRAQFDAFRSTGLRLDHINAHNHLHLHPTLLELILKIGPAYGLRAVRLPREPFWTSWRAAGTGFPRRLAAALLLAPWTSRVCSRLRGSGLLCNDWIFGMHDTAEMKKRTVARLLERLPDGVTEIHFHPGAADVDAELESLTDPGVVAALRGMGVQRGGFSDLSAEADGDLSIGLI